MKRLSRPSLAFTLVELLAAIGVIVVLATLTTIGIRRVAKDSRLAAGKNSVAAALANARALAMKENQIVMVVFRPKFDGPREQVVEMIYARWTGESYIIFTDQILDRFEPIPDAPLRTLARGIKVAGPYYSLTGSSTLPNTDYLWTTQSHLPGRMAGEAPGEIIGVMFGPDGTTITRNSVGDSARMFVDFNRDGKQRQNGTDFDNAPLFPGVDYPNNTNYCPTPPGLTGGQFFCHSEEDDEPYIDVVPFLAVFDDEAARERYPVAAWTDSNTRINDLTAYITENAEPIHFNRYTGVAVK